MRLAKIIQRSLRRTLAKGKANTADVALIYDDAPPPADPNDTATYAAGELKVETARALVHFVTVSDVAVRGMLEVEVGDVILDFDPGQSLEDRSGLRFLIDGKIYLQRTAGKEVTQFFDTIIEGRRMFRTVLASLSGVVNATVRHVSERENIVLYAYGLDSHRFTATATTAGRAVIAAGNDGPHVFTVSFDGTKALGIRADGSVEIGRVLAVGQTMTENLPRLEFWAGTRRLASLSADGQLAAMAYILTASDPQLPQDFEFRSAGGAWLASLGAGGILAKSIDATL